jgi:hypothetical protein
MNTANVIDLVELFSGTFGTKPYVVPGVTPTIDSTSYLYKVNSVATVSEKQFTEKGSLLSEKYRGVQILLPIRFYLADVPVAYFPYCVLSIDAKKTLIKTPMMQRKGEVNEAYNIGNYDINVKGFIIGENRAFPEADLARIKELFEVGNSFIMDNALTNIYLTDKNLSRLEQRRVIIESFSLMEVQGGRISARPFTMKVCSDSIFTLEWEV